MTNRPGWFRYFARNERGQVIVLFALSLVALLLIAGLVLDAARVYTVLRYQRSVADAAALAGAQDLQDPGTRTVSPTDYINARRDALRLLNNELGGSSSCDTSTDVTDCPITGTPYHVAITTPYPGAITVDTDRAVKVAIWQPQFPLTFSLAACVLSPCTSGTGYWSPGVASVAGLSFASQYAVETLRGMHWNKQNDTNAGDVTVTGGSQLTVTQGDVGTNTDVLMDGCGGSSPSNVYLDPGYRIDHYDTVNATWCPPLPKDHVIPNPIPDPNYYPGTLTDPGTGASLPVTPSPVPTYNTSADAQDTSSTCTGAIATAVANGYNPTNWPGLIKAGPLTTTNTVCYKPGIYNFDIKNLSNTTVVLLEPGVYWFTNGLTIYGPLIGGYEAGQPGASLVFTEGTQCTATGGSSACDFKGNNSPVVALNEGSCSPSSTLSCSTDVLTAATPALTWGGSTFNGAPVQVSLKGPGGKPIVVPETLIVTKDPGCTVAPTEPTTCNDKANYILTLPGGGSIYVAGVQYAPTDNVTVKGGSGSGGRIGQIIAWTVTYNGSSGVTEYYPGGAGNGVLRLDTACSPGVACP